MRMGCDETCLYCFPILLSAGFPFPALGISGSGLLAVFEKSKKNLNLKKTFLGGQNGPRNSGVPSEKNRKVDHPFCRNDDLI
jgi:hypothetical protein